MEPKKKPEENELKESELEQVAVGAVDNFLKIDGVDGESHDDTHKKEID
jgi:hypothetical protein